jgi:hypothetical protein
VTDLPQDEELVASAHDSIESLRSLLIPKLGPYSPRPGQKLVRLSIAWHVALLYRTVDLASAALSMFREGRLIPGCTLTRSLYETVAQLSYLYEKQVAAVESQRFEEIMSHVLRGAWGSKDGSTKETAIQVLTAIERLNKSFPGVQDEYFHLCEYAHPNMKGGIGTYTQIEVPAYDVHFGMNPQKLRMGPFGLGGLDIILTIVKELHGRHTEFEAAFQEAVFRNAMGKFTD